MNTLNDISDGEFLPFLQSLGVDTCKSFEWMLNDPEFSGVLRWIYSSLDHNNALTDREEYRYSEIKKKGGILSPKDLEDTVVSIQEQFPGICLPGDLDSKHDMELDIQFLEERLKLLQKQEKVYKDLIKQNEIVKDKITLDISHLNSAHIQCKEDEAKFGAECTELAKEIEKLTEELIVGVAEHLEVYANCKGNQDMSKRFLTFCPLESYRQSQALLRSHHELYVSKHFGNKPVQVTEELRMAVCEAKDMEERLSAAALNYVKSKADLCGEQAKLNLITNYNNVHRSQITPMLLEAQSALELLEGEENLSEHEAWNAVQQLVSGRTQLAVSTAVHAAADIRQHILSLLNQLVEIWQQAYALDRILYYSLRHELRTVEEFVQFATELRNYAVEENNAIASRIDSTNDIILEHAAVTEKISSNLLLQTLCSILGVPIGNDSKMTMSDDPRIINDTVINIPAFIVKAFQNLQASLVEAYENVNEGYRKKEAELVQFNKSNGLIRARVRACVVRADAALAHAARLRLQETDAAVLRATEKFAAVKNGDKKNIRKLWQWFLTDQTKFLAAVQNCNF